VSEREREREQVDLEILKRGSHLSLSLSL